MTSGPKSTQLSSLRHSHPKWEIPSIAMLNYQRVGSIWFHDDVSFRTMEVPAESSDKLRIEAGAIPDAPGDPSLVSHMQK